jgi:hypothetical protein
MAIWCRWNTTELFSKAIYVAAVVRQEDNGGPNAAVLWPYGAGGTQQNRSARKYMWLL